MPPATTTSFASVVSSSNRELFAREGYMILERVIPDDMLQMLREECAYLGAGGRWAPERGIPRRTLPAVVGVRERDEQY